MTNEAQVEQALIEYSREIGPKIRNIEKKKELLKDFKKTDEKAVELAQNVADAQAVLKKYIEDSETSLIAEIKSMNAELTTAIKGAARATKDSPRPYKAGELKAYFQARNKTYEQGKVPPVKKVIVKGSTFDELEKKIGTE